MSNPVEHRVLIKGDSLLVYKGEYPFPAGPFVRSRGGLIEGLRKGTLEKGSFWGGGFGVLLGGILPYIYTRARKKENWVFALRNPQNPGVQPKTFLVCSFEPPEYLFSLYRGITAYGVRYAVMLH